MIIIYLIISLLLLFIILCFILLVISQIIASFTSDAPFVPIPNGLEYEITENLYLDKHSVFYDLGCGDARVLKALSKQYPEAHFVGVEIAFYPYLLAKLKCRKNKNITIKRENIFTTYIGDATHIFLYLYPSVIDKLINKIETECKNSTTIISCDFEITKRTPTKVINTKNIKHPTRGKKLLIYKTT